jgi:hypothetical protein
MMKVTIGKGLTLDIDLEKLGLPHADMLGEVAEHVVYLGLKNMLQDAHAGIKKDEDADGEKSLAVAQKKLDAMYAGDIRVAGTREGDPVRAEAKRLAVKAIEAKIRKDGEKVADYDRKDITKLAVSIIDRYMDQAKANVEAAKAIEVPDIVLPTKKS